MAESPPNGLASLSAQRERARRSMPPPRHPIPVTEPVRADVSIPSGLESTAIAPLAPSSSVQERPLVAHTHVPSAPALGAPVRVTLYVDRQADDFMEAVRVAGLTARPKVDVSRSAVVRLALRRLIDEMTAAEVKVHLAQQDVRSEGPGRKRR
jgi:hypothetical protein